MKKLDVSFIFIISFLLILFIMAELYLSLPKAYKRGYADGYQERINYDSISTDTRIYNSRFGTGYMTTDDGRIIKSK